MDKAELVERLLEIVPVDLVDADINDIFYEIVELVREIRKDKK